MNNQTNKEVLEITDKCKVFEDKKTHARSIAVPFYLPDGSSAAIIVTRLKNEEWNPASIKTITIEYK